MSAKGIFFNALREVSERIIGLRELSSNGFNNFKDVAAATLERVLERAVQKTNGEYQTVLMMRDRVRRLLNAVAEDGALAGTAVDSKPGSDQEQILCEILEKGEQLR